LTAVRSADSYGIAEAFVKTFKQDFVYFQERLDAKTVIAQLEQWFEHYNEYRPRKRLKMKTLRQLIHRTR
jgi:putative transposase